MSIGDFKNAVFGIRKQLSVSIGDTYSRQPKEIFQNLREHELAYHL